MDEIVIDLEDAVPPTEKDVARERAISTLESGGWRAQTVAVRINGLESPWGANDAVALGETASPPDSLVVPKVEAAADLNAIDWILDRAEPPSARPRLGLQALIETAAGLNRVEEIAAASSRLQSLIIGYADLAASLGRSAAGARNLDLWLPSQEVLLRVARAAGLQAIDGPYLGVEVDADFEAATERARDLGFDGKWAIHPDQVERLSAAFSPTAEEVSRAESILAALRRAERAGNGAVAHDGEMIDEALRRAAERVLARAEGSRA